MRPDKPAMKLDALQPYYLGAHFTAVALQKKLVDEYGAAIRQTAGRNR